MRYIVAIVVASLLITVAALFVRQTELSLKDRIRQAIKADQAAGRVPPDVDPDRIEPRDLEIQLPAAFQMQLSLAFALKTWQFVLIPAVLVGCFGIALLLGGGRR